MKLFLPKLKSGILFFFLIFISNFYKAQTVCIGSTAQYTGIDPAGSNAWVSSNPQIATVSNSGLVTGVSAGTCTINFTNTSNVVYPITITVLSTQSSITLTSNVGTTNQTVTTSLTPITYSINNFARIYLSAGSFPQGVTGVFSGNTFTISGTPIEAGTFSYSLSANCGTCGFDGIIQSGTIVSNTASVCVSSTSQLPVVGTPNLNNPWTSSDNLIATVSNTGLVSGISAGTAIITYTDDNLTTIQYFISVNSPVAINSITGTTSICENYVSNLENTTPGGTWSSSNTAIATVNSEGIVSGVSAGTCNIIYTASPGGCSANASTPFTVNVSNPPTITLTSAPTTLDQTPIQDHISGDTIFYTTLVPITFSIGGGATGAYLAGGTSSLPAGVTAVFSGGTYTISGTPYYVYINDILTPPNQSKNYDYTVFPSGGTYCHNYGSFNSCGSNGGGIVGDTTAGGGGITGHIELPPFCVNTVSGPSNYIVCSNTSINLSYDVTGTATNVSVTGLPPGVSYFYSSGLLSFVGMAVMAGTYNFSITPMGGNCIQKKLDGIIIVEQMPSLIQISLSGIENQTVCINSTFQNIVYDNVGTQAFVMLSGNLPNGVTGIFDGSQFIISGTPTEAGTFSYTVMTTGSSCPPVFLSGSITVNTLSNIQPITGLTSVCLGTPTLLTNTTNGGVWSSSNTLVATVTQNGSVSGVTAGSAIISYTVTLNGGCSSTQTKSIIVNPIPTTSAILGLSTVCDNSSITLTNPTLGGNWSSSNTNTAFVSPNGVVTGNNAGTTNIIYTISDGTCSASEIKTITVLANPIVSSITGDNSVCINTTSQLNCSTNSGVWSSSNTSIATVSPSGLVNGVSSGTCTINYIVTSNGCSASQTNSVTILNPTTLALVTPIGTNNQTICVNSTLTTIQYFSVGSSSTITLTNGTSFPQGVIGTNNSGIFTISGTPTQAGTYPYTITTVGSQCGNEVTLSGVIVVETIPTASFTSQINNLDVQFTNTSANATLGYYWTFGNNIASYEVSPIFTYPNAGTYTVTLHAQNLCGWDSTSQVITVGINDLKQIDNSEFIIFPNPVQNELNIELKNNNSTQLIVQDITGRILFEEEYNQSLIQLKLDQFNSGEYFITIKQNSKSVIKKITKI